MCSIEEAWAGQDFDNKPVVSQADTHNAYMSLPDNVFHRATDLNLNEPNKPKSRELTRGINSKYSREPRVPKMVKNSNDVSMNISSQMPPLNNYGGLEPLPSFMTIYNNKAKHTQPQSSQPNPTLSEPQPISTGDHFTDIGNAFQTSRLMNNFMGVGRNHLNNEQEHFDDNLINQNTSEEDNIINRKYDIKKNRKNKNKSKFSNINSKNNNNDYDNVDNEYDNNEHENNYSNEYENTENDNEDNTNENNHMIKQNDVHIEKMLVSIIHKLNQMDENLHLYQKRNMYDIILYIIVGMLLSFVIYSAMRK